MVTVPCGRLAAGTEADHVSVFSVTATGVPATVRETAETFAGSYGPEIVSVPPTFAWLTTLTGTAPILAAPIAFCRNGALQSGVAGLGTMLPSSAVS